MIHHSSLWQHRTIPSLIIAHDEFSLYPSPSEQLGLVTQWQVPGKERLWVPGCLAFSCLNFCGFYASSNLVADIHFKRSLRYCSAKIERSKRFWINTKLQWMNRFAEDGQKQQKREGHWRNMNQEQENMKMIDKSDWRTGKDFKTTSILLVNTTLS